jgi:excisionase family DNA binding protein
MKTSMIAGSAGLNAERPLAYTRQAAAKALGVSLPTLDRLVSRGLLRPSRACRRPLFSLEELKRFLLVTTNGVA